MFKEILKEEAGIADSVNTTVKKNKFIYKVNKDIEKLDEHTLIHPGYFLLKSYKP